MIFSLLFSKMGYIVIAPVGDNPKALFVGIKEFPTERVILLTPPDKLKDAKKLEKQYPHIPIHWVDERFTSKMAKQSMLMSGMKKKKRRQKEIVDEISATIILQTYLEKTQL